MHDDIDKMYCGAIRRGDIIEGEFEEGKSGLMVVLQDDVLNQSLPTVICALIKPKREKEEALINEITLKKKEIGSERDGVCMLHKIFTIKREKIFAKKGELGSDRFVKIIQALDVTLGRFRDEIIES